MQFLLDFCNVYCTGVVSVKYYNLFDKLNRIMLKQCKEKV